MSVSVVISSPMPCATRSSPTSAVSLIGEASGREHALRIVRALPVVRRILRSRDVPLIAKIEDDGGVSILYEAGARLESARRIKPKARRDGA